MLLASRSGLSITGVNSDGAPTAVIESLKAKNFNQNAGSTRRGKSRAWIQTSNSP